MSREVQITKTAYNSDGSYTTSTMVEKMGFWRVFKEVLKFWKNWNTGFDDYDDMNISINVIQKYSK